MSYSIPNINKNCFLIICFMILCSHINFAQESNTNLSTKNTYHNQLYFNRFLINPTFSLVRENKSYLNILHRNQYATFNDNSQNYFLGFSNKLNDHTAVGIGVYSQWSGVIQEFGFNANFAKSIKLGDKSALTFGTNVTYFNEGLDKNRVVATEDDPEITEAGKESKVSIQPGVTLSVGRFDFGLYATDLLKYNQTTNEFLTRMDAKSIKASLQYTHDFMGSGLFRNAKLLPLFQVGQNEDGSVGYLGSVLLDMPKFGWLQTSWDDMYGLSMGLGFSLNSTMSLGYVLEKDLTQQDADFGWNHELSLAYTFKTNSAASTSYNLGSEDQKIDRIVRNYEEQIVQLLAEKEAYSKSNGTNKPAVATTTAVDSNSLAYENRLILDELILRQDSIEIARSQEFEKRFETIVRILKNDIKSNLQELTQGQQTGLAAQTPAVKSSKEAPASVRTVVAANTTAAKTPEEEKNKKQKDFLELPIKVLNQADMVGVKTGYYVIANVFKNKSYLNSFVNKLNSQGINAQHFYNKENGLYYVYLADYNFRKDAETAFVSDLNGKYQDEKWIMQVDSPTATVANSYSDDETYIRRN